MSVFFIPGTWYQAGSRKQGTNVVVVFRLLRTYVLGESI